VNFLDRLSKNTHIKFHDNRSSGSHVVPCGRTDRQDRRDEANSRFSQFSDGASNPIARGVPANDLHIVKVSRVLYVKGNV